MKNKYQEALKRLRTNEYLTSREQREYYNLLQELVDKPGKLEDLEDELGCPLEVVFKALKEGYQYELKTTNIITKKAVRQIIPTSYAYLLYSDGWWWIATVRNSNRLIDYGKTWWLKGEVIDE